MLAQHPEVPVRRDQRRDRRHCARRSRPERRERERRGRRHHRGHGDRGGRRRGRARPARRWSRSSRPESSSRSGRRDPSPSEGGYRVWCLRRSRDRRGSAPPRTEAGGAVGLGIPGRSIPRCEVAFRGRTLDRARQRARGGETTEERQAAGQERSNGLEVVVHARTGLGHGRLRRGTGRRAQLAPPVERRGKSRARGRRGSAAKSARISARNASTSARSAPASSGCPSSRASLSRRRSSRCFMALPPRAGVAGRRRLGVAGI